MMWFSFGSCIDVIDVYFYSRKLADLLEYVLERSNVE